MGLIKKLNNFYRINSEVDFDATMVISECHSIGSSINNIRKILEELSTTKKSEKQERLYLIKRLYEILDNINYDYYLLYLHDLKTFLAKNANAKLSLKNQKQIKFALETNSLLRKNFETIYKNFKSIAKRFEDIPMKEVLTRMQECFYLNTSLTTQQLTDLDKAIQTQVANYKAQSNEYFKH